MADLSADHDLLAQPLSGNPRLFGGRSEVVRVLRGQPTNEMWRLFNLRAIWFASEVLAVVVVGAFVYEIARGQDGQPCALLGFVFAVAHVAALLRLRWRG